MANPNDPRYELEREPFGFGDLLTEWKSLLFSREAFYVAWALLTLFLAGGWFVEYVGRRIRPVRFEQEAQAVLHRDWQAEIRSVTYRKPGFMERPFFVVWMRARNAETFEPLLTVENSMDSVAGAPVVHESPEGLQIMDDRPTYVFDVGSRKFVENEADDEVYAGVYRNCLDPPH